MDGKDVSLCEWEDCGYLSMGYPRVKILNSCTYFIPPQELPFNFESRSAYDNPGPSHFNKFEKFLYKAPHRNIVELKYCTRSIGSA